MQNTSESSKNIPNNKKKNRENIAEKKGEGSHGEQGDKAVTAAAMLVVMATAGESR